MDWKITDGELFQPNAESLLVGNNKDYQESVGYLRQCVATCYPRNTNHLNKINKVRYKSKIITILITTTIIILITTIKIPITVK